MSKQDENYNDFIKKRDQQKEMWIKFTEDTDKPPHCAIHAKWADDGSYEELLEEFEQWKNNNNLN